MMIELPKYPFSITLEDAKRLIGKDVPKDYRTIKPYYEGDHWQNGAAWVGPMPKHGEDGYVEVMEEIRKAFTSQNMVEEVVDRHMMGIMGREPSWGFTPIRPLRSNEKPTKEEQYLIDELEALMTAWWDERGIHQLIQEVVSTLLWSSVSPARLYVPKGLLTEGTRGDGTRVRVIKAGSMEEALNLVYLAHHSPTQATVYIDQDSMQKLGLYLYKDDEGKDIVEATWVDQLGMTVLEMIEDHSKGYFTFNYGGRIPMFRMKRKGLINDQVLQNQRALNLALSMNPRNVVTGGFLERILLNAQMPGEWELNEKGERVKFKPEPYYSGAGTTNFLRGVDFQDEDGKFHLARPEVVFRDPVDVKPAIEAGDLHQLKILEEVDQAHILTTSSQYQSGKSKEQARADFMASLNLTRNPVDQLGRWVLDTAVAMAEQFMGEPGKYTNTIRAVFTAKPDYGPLAFEERRQYNEAMEKGVLSRERNMHLQGIDDVDAELAKINEERLGNLDMAAKQIAVLKAGIEAGMSPRLAAIKAGLTEAEAAQIESKTLLSPE